MTRPSLVYAANRAIGLDVLKLLLEFDWRPRLLLVPGGKKADHTEEMKALLPGIDVLEGVAFRSGEGIERIRSVAPDYVLSIHFPYLFPAPLLELPRVGTLNLHPAYLPFNRGWHTPSWAILERTPYGATLHWVDESIDTGDIAMQVELTVRPDETAHQLYARVLALELELMREAIPLMAERELPHRLQEVEGTSHGKRDLASVQELDPHSSMRVGELIDRLRALTTNKWDEAACFEREGKRYRIRVEIREDTE